MSQPGPSPVPAWSLTSRSEAQLLHPAQFPCFLHNTVRLTKFAIKTNCNHQNDVPPQGIPTDVAASESRNTTHAITPPVLTPITPRFATPLA